MINRASSHRAFLLASIGLAATKIARPQSTQTLTAGQALDCIETNIGIP